MDRITRRMLEKLRDDMVEVKIVLTRNTTSLEEHIKRSHMLESKLDTHEETLRRETESLRFVKQLGRLIPWMLGICVGVLACLTYLKVL